MNRFISTHIFAVTILIGTTSFAQSPSPAERSQAVPTSLASDTVDVQHFIDAYHEAVLSHDGPRLAQLFIPEGSMFLNVLSDDTYARAKVKSPDAVKVHVGSYTDFVKLVLHQEPASIQRTHIWWRTAMERLLRCTLTSYS